MKRQPDGSFHDDSPATSVCRECSNVLDTSTCLTDDDAPAAGAISICAHCGCVSIFEDDRLLREPTETEIVEWKSSKQWKLIERTVALCRLNRGKKVVVLNLPSVPKGLLDAVRKVVQR